MTGPPTTQILLDDGSGTFPTDVTSRQEDSIQISEYGRTDEFDEPQSTQLTVVLDNTDGALTSGGGGGFGLGGFGLGGFGLGGGGSAAIFPGQVIRVVETVGATTVNRFTGAISGIDLDWPGGGHEFSHVQITAVDALADLSRRPMRSLAEEEVLLDGPSAFFTLAESEGSAAAGDTSGNGMPALTTAGSGTAVTFGATSPVDGLTGAQFSGGQYLSAESTSGFLGTGSWSLEFMFNAPSPPASFGGVAQISHATGVPGGGADSALWIETKSTGQLFVQSTGSFFLQTPGSVCDGQEHHICVTWDVGVSVSTLYLDGAAVATSAAGTDFGVPAVDLTIGKALSDHFTGTVSAFAIYDGAVLPAARVASHAGALTGFAGDSTDQRFARIASYVDMVTTIDTPSGQVMGPQDTTGQSVFDALQTVATAEGGVAFVGGDGDLVLQGRYHRGQKVTPDITLGELEAGEDTTVSWDTQQKITQVTVTRPGGATQTYPALSPGSQVFPQSLDLAVDTDEHALLRAQWVVGKYGSPAPRIGSLTFDLLQSPNAEALLALQIGDRIDFSALPSQNWSGATSYTVEGWDETLADDEWTLTVNLLPWELFEVLILDDSTYGVLDGGVPIGY